MINAIKKLNLNIIHPIIKKKINRCKNFITFSTNPDSYYVDHFNIFLIYTNKSNPKGHSREEKIAHVFSKVQPYFKYLYETMPESLYATTFLTNYMQTSIDNILDAFHFINLHETYKDSKHYKNSIFTKVELKKIATNYLIIMLAKCFCYFDTCEKISVELFGKNVHGALLDNGIVSIIDTLMEKFIEDPELESWNIALSSKKKTRIASYIWEKYYTKMYHFFEQRNVIEYIEKHPELFTIFIYKTECEDLFIRKKKTKPITEILISSIINKSEFFFYFVYLIEEYEKHSKATYELEIKLDFVPVESHKLLIEV